MPYIKGAKTLKPGPKEPTKPVEPDDADLEELEPVVLTEPEKVAKAKILALVASLTPEVRGVLIDDLMEAYCSMCSETLDEDGDCPEGCEPDDLDEDDEDDDEGDDGEPDEDDEEEETT
jgi:hypothetical protein